MSFERKQKQRIKRRVLRVRSAFKSSGLPRVSVFRSARHIYAQLIDIAAGKTIASSSSLQIKQSGSKKEVAKSVGLELAKKAQGLGVDAVVFDRGSFLYHGRIEQLAEGLREGGLKL